MSQKTPMKTPRKTPLKSPAVSDRFIPLRSSMDLDVCRFNLSKDTKENGGSTGEGDGYDEALRKSLFEGKEGAKVLALQSKAPAPPPGYTSSSLRVMYSQARQSTVAKRSFRHIAQTPERILDAPNLVDDFYLNLVDWNSQNVLAVALGTAVYLWNASTGDIEQLMETSSEGDYVTSVSWVTDGMYLAVGTNLAETQVWDVSRLKQVRSMRGHSSRIGCMSWNEHILTTGSRDSKIFHHDVRIASHHIATLEGHEQEVCGLRWSPDGTQLASGGNDNLLNIWDARGTTPRFTLDHHSAAVKALAWCPWQGHLLASGGGTADRTLKFWNTTTGALLNSIDTKSQVCGIVWNPHDKEVLTSHGFSQNQLSLWKYPSLVKMADLTGHTSRVLHLALSPDGTTVVSAAGDETLRFWKVFAESSHRRKERTRMPHGMDIR